MGNNTFNEEQIKKECIAFAEWTVNEFYYPHSTLNGIEWDHIPPEGPDDTTIGTTEQLYNLYLQQTKDQ